MSSPSSWSCFELGTRRRLAGALEQCDEGDRPQRGGSDQEPAPQARSGQDGGRASAGRGRRARRPRRAPTTGEPPPLVGVRSGRGERSPEVRAGARSRQSAVGGAGAAVPKGMSERGAWPPCAALAPTWPWARGRSARAAWPAEEEMPAGGRPSSVRVGVTFAAIVARVPRPPASDRRRLPDGGLGGGRGLVRGSCGVSSPSSPRLHAARGAGCGLLHGGRDGRRGRRPAWAARQERRTHTAPSPHSEQGQPDHRGGLCPQKGDVRPAAQVPLTARGRYPVRIECRAVRRLRLLSIAVAALLCCGRAHRRRRLGQDRVALQARQGERRLRREPEHDAPVADRQAPRRAARQDSRAGPSSTASTSTPRSATRRPRPPTSTSTPSCARSPSTRRRATRASAGCSPLSTGRSPCSGSWARRR